MRLLTISFIVMAILLGACKKTPPDVLDSDKMASLLADMHRGEGAVEMNRRSFSTDSSKRVLQKAILLRHGVTEEDFERSSMWYAHNMEEYKQVYEKVISILESEMEQTDANAQRLQMSIIGDSVDIWSFSPRYIIKSSTPSKDIITYLLPDDNWEKGDNYTLNFKVINSLTPFKSMIGVKYDDNQLEWIENPVNDNGKYSFSLITDSTKKITEVYGWISVNPVENETVFLDSVSMTRTRVNKENYNRRYQQKRIKLKAEVVPLIENADTLKEEL